LPAIVSEALTVDPNFYSDYRALKNELETLFKRGNPQRNLLPISGAELRLFGSKHYQVATERADYDLCLVVNDGVGISSLAHAF
jgi:hypothetical protein